MKTKTIIQMENALQKKVEKGYAPNTPKFGKGSKFTKSIGQKANAQVPLKRLKA